MERDTWRLALASVEAGILAVTLIPVHAGLLGHRFVSLAASFRHGSIFSLFDAFQNILLFMPLGFLLASGHEDAVPARPWLRSGAWAMALSSAIECAQAFMPGRFASVWDIAFNTLGGLAGAWIALRSVPRPAPRHA